MSWVSTVGRRFLLAYSEGLAMTCPQRRAGDLLETTGCNIADANSETAVPRTPAMIDLAQHDLRAALRPEFAGALDPASTRHH